MNTIYTIQNFREWRQKISDSLGLIPTMGALHNGHLSLIERSINMCRYTVVSIYLNPAQFAQNENALMAFCHNLSQFVTNCDKSPPTTAGPAAGPACEPAAEARVARLAAAINV